MSQKYWCWWLSRYLYKTDKVGCYEDICGAKFRLTTAQELKLRDKP